MATTTSNNTGASIARIEEQEIDHVSQSLLRTALRRLRRDYLTLGAMSVLLILGMMAIFAPAIEDAYGVSYTLPDSSVRLFAPCLIAPCPENASLTHPLGTDNLGRDMLARLLYGGRVSLGIGFTAAIFSTLLGVSIGLLAGYYQGSSLGFIDDGIMWFITTLNSIPTLLLLILLGSVLSPTITTLIFVLTIVSWTNTMRLIRGETIAHRSNEYVISAQAVGARPMRVMFVHVLPNTFSVLITALAIQVGTIILVESALSFLGLGVRPPEPSWGNMLTEAQAYFRQGAHMSILPGIMIVITVLSTYLIGDGLRDAFDPRSTK
jgi:peptide/nickel transport system permease protein